MKRILDVDNQYTHTERLDKNSSIVLTKLPSGLYITRDNISHQQYRCFINTHNPVQICTLVEAKAFCKILSQRTGKPYRLPTTDEWVYAVNLGYLHRQSVCLAKDMETLEAIPKSTTISKITGDLLNVSIDWCSDGPSDNHRWQFTTGFRVVLEKI